MASKKTRMRMKDIATATDVSVATVSYVLNGKGRISPEKQQQIWELLQQSGYRPKYYQYPIFYISNYSYLEDLGTMRPYTDGILGMNALFHEKELTFRTDFIRTKNSAPVDKQLQEICKSRPGGVIVNTNLDNHCQAACEYFESKAVPVVQMGFHSRTPKCDACTVDNFAGGYDAARYFLENGHRNIAVIRWDENVDTSSPLKFAGFTCALKEAGVPLPEEYIAHCEAHRTNWPEIPGRVAAMTLASLPKPPTAVFIENSYISPALLFPISMEERSVPEAIRHLDMIHFEAWDLSNVEQVMLGKLSYTRDKAKLLKINWEELGRMAASRVISRMANREIQAGEMIRLAPKLVVQ